MSEILRVCFKIQVLRFTNIPYIFMNRSQRLFCTLDRRNKKIQWRLVIEM